MDGEKRTLPSEKKGSVKEAIGKVNGDRAAEAEGAAEVKAARARRQAAAASRENPERPDRENNNGT